ncbi:MAG: TAXI family TRAP transporter solute-binding subunit [Janthinobacterium lividum]
MRSLILFIIIPKLLLTAAIASEDKKGIKIGTGSILEGYYNIGLTICEYINKSSGYSCEVVPTNGSKENLNLLQSNKIDFALVQSNIALDAFSGIGSYTSAQPNLALRQILNLYDEIFTIIAKDDDKIKVFADIAGKRISNGNPSSASTLTYDNVRSYYSFAKPVDIELSQEDYEKQLCDGNIDAIMLITGHPNALVSLIANNCDIDFVAIEKGKLQRILGSNKAYRKIRLLKDMYPGIAVEQDALAVQAILITTDKIDPKIVENLENYFTKNVQKFKQSNPILNNVEDKRFFSDFVLPKHESLIIQNN